MQSTTLIVTATLVFAPLLPAQTTLPPELTTQRLVQRCAIVTGLSSTQQEHAGKLVITEQTAKTTIRTAERTEQQSLYAAVGFNGLAQDLRSSR